MGRTRKLSPEQRDEYLDLCCAYWIADCAMSEETMKENSDLYEFFTSKGLVSDEGITWLNEQFDKLNDTREKRRLAGAKGGKAKANKPLANAKQMLSNSQANTKQILAEEKEEKERREEKERNMFDDEDDFSFFWDAYGKKTGRTPTHQKWKRLPKKDKEEILSKVIEYAAQFSDKQFQPNPLTFLNQRRWEDEIQEPQKTKPNEKGFNPTIDQERVNDWLNS